MPNPEHGTHRPRFPEFRDLAGITPKPAHETGANEPYKLKNLRKTSAICHNATAEGFVSQINLRRRLQALRLHCCALRSAPPPHELHFRQSASDTSASATSVGVSGRRAPDTSACARMSRRPKQIADDWIGERPALPVLFVRAGLQVGRVEGTSAEQHDHQG